MIHHPSVSTEKRIQSRALRFTLFFYVLIFLALIIGYQEDMSNYFPDSLMDFMDTLFKEVPSTKESKPQAGIRD